MNERHYDVMPVDGGVPVKMWTRGVTVEEAALNQLRAAARMPFIFGHVAAMPDVHTGIGATVGSVIPTKGAIIPAAVGVDIGCGMCAAQTTLMASDLPDNLEGIRSAIERAVPHGRTVGRGTRDKGSWGDPPPDVVAAWQTLEARFQRLTEKYPALARANHVTHLGTLGTGNHFVEICLDEADRVWVMLHSGSRGVGNAIGTFFIELAKKDMRRWFINLPDEDLAYFPEGSDHFDDYVEAVGWAQDFAALNRRMMMTHTMAALARVIPKPFGAEVQAINCHHNYVRREKHFGQNVIITRKGAVRAGAGEMGIIPGSMGTRSYIVRGRGNSASFESCSHGAGRVMSRNEARRRFTLEDHARATEGVECRKDADVIDETPMAYKPIEAVMAAQADLVEIVHTLKQVVCVKG
ncbi:MULTISPECIES: RtcB family protein [unclassified Azospirillum]|uniref:RtcB family protein n=1 Tax=unclassified Azospirillum TaxID=2630922 RepID=UPI000B727899|nr:MULTISPECIES: RtcB family protein [unclassified Azospirillum]SNS15684.1 tRNA-splicing ligase RtcB [Azospirillum sp. RU38E]SNS32974.1 tRNA-splicing ligase RtcB [Azospirillum sp. RU37A]